MSILNFFKQSSVSLCALILSSCSVYVFSIAPGASTASAEHLRLAEDYADQNNYEQAIKEYRAHIDDRLTLDDRPDWENPWFYLILISDLQLKSGDPSAALQSLDQAKSKDVDASLVADRYRAIARWYEERGELEKSFDILKKYREIDPLLFDSILDRLGRKIVANEETH